MEIPSDLDKECKDLFLALNSLPGIETTESCCGHGRDSFDFWLRCANLNDLFPLMRAVDRRYAGGNYAKWTWRLEVSLGDMCPFISFRLTSGVVSNDLIYEQADHIAKTIMQNIAERLRLEPRIVMDSYGSVAEWVKASVSKTDEGKPSAGSNPAVSAMKAEIVTIKTIDGIDASDLKFVTLSNGQTVVTGDHYEEGQPGIFIPEGAIVPEKLLREMWLWNEELQKGRLSGKSGNRIKSRIYAGHSSAGLFYGAYYFHEGQKLISPSWNDTWQTGQDVATEVGIT